MNRSILWALSLITSLAVAAPAVEGTVALVDDACITHQDLKQAMHPLARTCTGSA